MIRFNINKTIQAAAYLIKRQPGHRENYMRLLKLLYLAERRSLEERGTPICGDTAYAMKRGPVPSATLDLIKGSYPSSREWERFIETDGYDVRLLEDPGNLHLSRADIKILESVAESFRSLDEWGLVEWCHDHLGEYQKAWESRGEKDRCPIQLKDVLAEIGRLGDQERIVEEANEATGFDRLFSHHMPAGWTA